MRKLTLEEQYQVYSHYVGDFTLPCSMKSPFRSDFNPSFGLFISEEEGKIRWSDFALGKGDIYDFIQEYEKVNFVQSRKTISEILKGTAPPASINYKIKTLPKPSLKVRSLNDIETYYWKIRGVTDTSGIYGLESLSWGNGSTVMSSTEERPKFVYDLSGDLTSWKIYNPYYKDPKNKWKSYNTKAVAYEGENKNKHTKGIIYSSTKDRKVALTFIKNYEAINPIAEGNFKGIIQELDKSLAGVSWWAFLDFDKREETDLPNVKRGVERTLQMVEESGGRIRPILLTEEESSYFSSLDIKDIDEVVMKLGSKGKELITKIVNERTREEGINQRKYYL